MPLAMLEGQGYWVLRVRPYPIIRGEPIFRISFP